MQLSEQLSGLEFTLDAKFTSSGRVTKEWLMEEIVLLRPIGLQYQVKTIQVQT